MAARAPRTPRVAKAAVPAPAAPKSKAAQAPSARASSARRALSPRTLTLGSLNRTRWTDARIKQMIAYVRRGTVPVLGALQRRRFLELARSYTWRVVRKPIDRWLPRLVAAAAVAVDDAAVAADGDAVDGAEVDAGDAEDDVADAEGEMVAGGGRAEAAGDDGVDGAAGDVDGMDDAPAAAAETQRVLEVWMGAAAADGGEGRWVEVLRPSSQPAALAALWSDVAQGGALRGARAFYNAVAERYVGVGESTVRDFVRRQETAAVTAPIQHLLVAPSTPTAPGQQWHVDLTMIPLPTRTHAKWLAVAIDAFSKFAWAMPLPSKHSSAIVSWLERLWLENEAPQRLRTDGGGEFVNGSVKLLCLRYDVLLQTAAPYHSQSNGMIERLNRTVKGALQRAALEHSATRAVDWVDLLPHVLRGYNCTRHSTTGYTPHLLHYGRECRPLGPLQLAPDAAGGGAAAGSGSSGAGAAGSGAGAAGAAGAGAAAGAAGGGPHAFEGGPASAVKSRARGNTMPPSAAGAPPGARAGAAPGAARGGSAAPGAARGGGAAPGAASRRSAAPGAASRKSAAPGAPGAAAGARGGGARLGGGARAGAGARAGGGAVAAGAGAGAASASASESAAAAFGLERVIALRYNTLQRRKEYLVRWAGYTPEADSWISPRWFASTDKRFDDWIVASHAAAPVDIGEWAPPPGFNPDIEQKATEQDRLLDEGLSAADAADADAEAGDDGEGGGDAA